MINSLRYAEAVHYYLTFSWGFPGSRFIITGIVAVVLGFLTVALVIGTFAYK